MKAAKTKTTHLFPLTLLVRIGLLAATLGSCAVAVTACSSPSAAPSAQTAANNAPTNHPAATPTTTATTSPTPSVTTTPPSTLSLPPPSTTPASTTVGALGAATPSQPSTQQGGPASTQRPNPLAPPPGVLTAKLIGMPTSIVMGSAPVQFQAVITNPTAVDYPSVAPVFQIVGGPANHINGTLQQYDSATRTWQNAPMPEGDGANPLTYATHGTDLRPGQSLTITYRLTVSTQNPAEPTAAILYAAAPPSVKPLAMTGISGRITKT